MSWREIDAYLRSRGIRFGYQGTFQTTGGRHAPGSLHYAGRARDYGDADSDCHGIYRVLEPFARQGIIVELFWQNKGWKYGRWIGQVGGHWDHVHAAIAAGKTLPRGGGEDDMSDADVAKIDRHADARRDDLKRYMLELKNQILDEIRPRLERIEQELRSQQ